MYKAFSGNSLSGVWSSCWRIVGRGWKGRLESNWGGDVAKTIKINTEHSTQCFGLGETSEETALSPGFVMQRARWRPRQWSWGGTIHPISFLTGLAGSGLGQAIGVNNEFWFSASFECLDYFISLKVLALSLYAFTSSWDDSLVRLIVVIRISL